MKRLISFCLALAMVLGIMVMLAPQAQAAEVDSGTCGMNVTWVLDSHSNLIISGTGDTDHYYPPMLTPVPAIECTRIIINNGVTGIGSNLFIGCYYLTSVSIPDSVTRISDSAFTDCHSLTDVYYSGTQAQWESISINPSNEDLLNATIHFNSSDDYWEVNNTGIASGPITETLAWTLDTNGKLTISGTGEMRNFYNSTYAPWYSYKNAIKSVQIDNGVTNIGDHAFSSCSNLQIVSLPDSITTIGDFSFSSCESLTSIELPSQLTTIGEQAFYGSALESISLPASIENIGWGAFGSCLSLKTIYFEGSAPSIDDYAFVTMEGGFRPEGYPVTTATVYYPANDPTWTPSVRKNYSGNLTWVPYGDLPNVTRLAGDTRFETAFEIADDLKEIWDINKFDTIIIASGTSAADALSGSYLANVKSAPILLSCNADFNPKYVEKYNNMLLEYIQSNLKSGGTVYILGGEKAVDPSLDDALSGYHVVRLAGATRYETNLLILKEAGISTDQEILVCNGTGFAGALASSATGLPILLIKGDSGQLTAEQSAYLKSLPNSYCIIGGPDSISVAFESVISSYGTTVRLSGANRFETSIMVAERYFDDPDGAVLAYAWNYPDGLCGGALGYVTNSPMILTDSKYYSYAVEYSKNKGITFGIILGGTSLISDTAVQKIFAID